MRAAGTKSFDLKFLYFNHKNQRWQAECRIGEVAAVLCCIAGLERWFVKGKPEVEVPRELCEHLSRITREALEEYQSLKEYKQAVGQYPKERIQ